MEPDPPKLAEELFAKINEPRSFSAHYFHRLDSSVPLRLPEVLGVRQEQLSNVAAAALAAIEEISGTSTDWMNLRWKLSVFIGLQDIFDCKMPEIDRGFNPRDLATMFQVYYFYHESRMILLESFLAGLNGLYVASSALLRVFLEFSVYQNYYYRLGNKTGNHRALATTLKKGHYPAWNTALKGCLPLAKFCGSITTRLEKHRQALSESTQHVYGPQSSSRSHRSDDTGHSAEGIFFWLKIDYIISAALWIYYANFPCLFFPVDIFRKFGFNAPVGLFAGPQLAHDVQKTLSETDFAKFKAFAVSNSDFKQALSWCESQPDLSDEEIWETWNEESNGPRPESIELAQVLSITKMRGLGLAMAYGKIEEDDHDDPPGDEWLRHVDTLEFWSRIRGRN